MRSINLGKASDDTVEGGLFDEVLFIETYQHHGHIEKKRWTYGVPWQSSTRPRERRRHPRVLVLSRDNTNIRSIYLRNNKRTHREIPNRDPDTLLNRVASCNHILIICLLLLVERRRRGQRHPNIQLSDRHLQSQCRELLHLTLERRRDLAHNQMTLETDTVEWNVCGLERFDEREHRIGFSRGVFEVVLVDVEFGRRIGGAGGGENSVDVGGAEGVVEDVCAPGAIVVEGLVDDVEGVCGEDLENDKYRDEKKLRERRTGVTLVVREESGAVVDHGAGEGRTGKTVHPAGKLVVPDTIVTCRR